MVQMPVWTWTVPIAFSQVFKFMLSLYLYAHVGY